MKLRFGIFAILVSTVLVCAEETPLPLKILSCKAIYSYLKLDTANAANVDLCLAGLHGVKGKTSAGLAMIYAGRPAAGTPAFICEILIEKKNGVPTSHVTWCDTINPNGSGVGDSLALKAALSSVLQLMKDLPRDRLPTSHPVVTTVKSVPPPKGHEKDQQFIVAVEEQEIIRAETMAVLVSSEGKVLEMKIMKTVP